jgi:hypothetical protein
MGRISSTQGGMRDTNYNQNVKERNDFGVVDIDEMIIVNLEEYVFEIWTNM